MKKLADLAPDMEEATTVAYRHTHNDEVPPNTNETSSIAADSTAYDELLAQGSVNCQRGSHWQAHLKPQDNNISLVHSIPEGNTPHIGTKSLINQVSQAEVHWCAIPLTTLGNGTPKTPGSARGYAQIGITPCPSLQLKQTKPPRTDTILRGAQTL